MPEKLGVSPKKLDSQMSLATDAMEAKRLLRRAVPRLEDEKLKAWFPRAARLLSWSQRRVRAYWHGEARVIHHREIKTLEQRVEALKQAGQRHREKVHEIRDRASREGGPLPFRTSDGPC